MLPTIPCRSRPALSTAPCTSPFLPPLALTPSYHPLQVSAGAYNVSALPSTLRAKAWVMGQSAPYHVVLPPLPPSGVECDATRLEGRIDWSVIHHELVLDGSLMAP